MESSYSGWDNAPTRYPMLSVNPSVSGIDYTLLNSPSPNITSHCQGCWLTIMLNCLCLTIKEDLMLLCLKLFYYL